MSKVSKYEEIKVLSYGDFLICKGCLAMIWQPTGPYRFGEVDRAYYQHLKSCMSLKKLVVKIRRGESIPSVFQDER